jgi:DNA-binding response OmpR family regulator
MKVLLLEDERKLGSFIRQGIKEQGYECDWLLNGDEAYEALLHTVYDACVLDIMVPGRDGLSLVRKLRGLRIKIPVIFISARGELDERLEGLTSGADDYLVKPFYVEELIARLRVIVKRTQGNLTDRLVVGDLILNLLTRKVVRGDQEIVLSAREFSLLEYMMSFPERIFTRTQLIEHVWHSHFDRSSNVIDVYISRLREKIDGDRDEKLIHTIRGVGYKIEA